MADRVAFEFDPPSIFIGFWCRIQSIDFFRRGSRTPYLVDADAESNDPDFLFFGVLPEGATIIDTRTSDRDVTHLVRLTLPLLEASWQVSEPTLDEIIMAYLRLGTDSRSTDQRGGAS